MIHCGSRICWPSILVIFHILHF